MLLKVKGSQAADVPHTVHKHGVVPHKLEYGWGAAWQGEVEHKGSEDDAGHLFQKQQRLQRGRS